MKRQRTTQAGIVIILLAVLLCLPIAALAGRFVDNNNGTITDTRTGLIWLKNANPCNTKMWNDALAYCNSLATGQAGLTDGSTAGQWRLPSIGELEGIGTDPPTRYCLDGSCANPSVTWTMPGKPFTNVRSKYYWSSTTFAYYPDHAWFVYMFNGSVSHSIKSYYYDFFAWPVRDGN